MTIPNEPTFNQLFDLCIEHGGNQNDAMLLLKSIKSNYDTVIIPGIDSDTSEPSAEVILHDTNEMRILYRILVLHYCGMEMDDDIAFLKQT